MQKIRCPKCKQLRSLDEFARDKYQASGHKSHCKYCCRAKTAEWQQSVKNRPKIQKTEKRCSHCKKIKATEEFAETVYTLDGRLHHCRACQSGYDRKFIGQPKKELVGKECTRCGIWKGINNFPKAARTSDGHQDWCFECFKEDYQNKRDARMASMRLYDATHRTDAKLRNQKNYRENREDRLEWQKAYFRDRYKGTPQYYAHMARKNSKRRARELVVENTLTDDERALILALQDYKCLACGCEFDPAPRRSKSLTWDHIIPVSEGGGLTFENTQALCLGCNTRKGKRKIDYRTWDPAAIIRNVKRA